MGIFLVVQFNWPRPFQQEHGTKARLLHDRLQGQEWIEEVLAGSGGIGGGPSSIWVFKLADFAGIDRLLAGDEPVSEAYRDFFGEMVDVHDFVREEVRFI